MAESRIQEPITWDGVISQSEEDERITRVTLMMHDNDGVYFVLNIATQDSYDHDTSPATPESAPEPVFIVPLNTISQETIHTVSSLGLSALSMYLIEQNE